MHVKRYLALFLCAGLSVTAHAAVASVTIDEGVDQTFTYSGPDLKTVGVAGEFSNWSVLSMIKGDSGVWSRTAHLKPGYYGYKFVVNGEWVLDPANPARKVVDEIEDSAVSVGGVPPPVAIAAAGPAVSGKIPTKFSYTDANAKSVQLAGEFNDWLDNVEGKVSGHAEWMLQNDGSGNWTLTVPLTSGKHTFKYVVDGGAHWELDAHLPVASDGNSIIETKTPTQAPTQAQAVGTTSPSRTGASFTYVDPSAKNVAVAGEFNEWNAEANPMRKDQRGIWTVTIPLMPGKYQYKFVVDDAWKADPASPDKADDGFGGENSVKTIEP